MDIQRRDFNKMILAAAGGILSGATIGCSSSEKKQPASGGSKDAKATEAKHICKGQNTCKGKGGCQTAENSCAGKNACKGKGGCASQSYQHGCKGKNACKGQGGCKAGDGGCAGKNTCKGNGGCKVPVGG